MFSGIVPFAVRDSAQAIEFDGESGSDGGGRKANKRITRESATLAGDAIHETKSRFGIPDRTVLKHEPRRLWIGIEIWILNKRAGNSECARVPIPSVADWELDDYTRFGFSSVAIWSKDKCVHCVRSAESVRRQRISLEAYVSTKNMFQFSVFRPC